MSDTAGTPGLQRVFPRGTVIFKEGDTGHEAYLLQQGTVRIFKTTAGRKITIGRVWPFQVFGEMALLDDSPRMATALVDDDATCLVLTKEAIRTMMDQAPPGLNTLIQSLLATIRELGDDLADARSSLADHGVE
ncbi:Crp/Fnr family transcriptional regulator [Paramagnetospirillum magneticum]|uniref:cAMP-binding protein n=1 Tax=Paramagnetospirillum magneticum (strain ATCC 700264 / AMB-1) TaxID=342108 RepID=Q2W9J2_PARM1|nr:cyclic nucleotide-binding domain-containing protein [Paramagnetospirillum magneticum]BAE49483.1 cAMP-binding protein [Paramagnetospirillum magneticum AMB-1]